MINEAVFIINLRNELNLKIDDLSINLAVLHEFPSKYEKCKDTLAKIRKEIELYKLGYSEVLSNRTTALNLAFSFLLSLLNKYSIYHIYYIIFTLCKNRLIMYKIHIGCCSTFYNLM